MPFKMRSNGTTCARQNTSDRTGSDSPPGRHTATSTTAASRRFRVATYNVLSDDTIRPGEYLYCPAPLRYMSSRHRRIVAEISGIRPHVVCLQVSVVFSRKALHLVVTRCRPMSARLSAISVSRREVPLLCRNRACVRSAVQVLSTGA